MAIAFAEQRLDMSRERARFFVSGEVRQWELVGSGRPE